MSVDRVTTDRFWKNFKSEIGETLTDDQRAEIDRAIVLSAPGKNNKISDLRLSLGWFFVRLAWGWEKRSSDRIKQEQEIYPAMAPRNAPMLASLVAGSLAFWLLALCGTTVLFAYLMT